ncbi:Formin BNI1 [Varanus komodoensis]|nr:Formin BNI1 [Varanus komodoensis]
MDHVVPLTKAGQALAIELAVLPPVLIQPQEMYSIYNHVTSSLQEKEEEKEFTKNAARFPAGTDLRHIVVVVEWQAGSLGEGQGFFPLRASSAQFIIPVCLDHRVRPVQPVLVPLPMKSKGRNAVPTPASAQVLHAASSCAYPILERVTARKKRSLGERVWTGEGNRTRVLKGSDGEPPEVNEREQWGHPNGTKNAADGHGSSPQEGRFGAGGGGEGRPRGFKDNAPQLAAAGPLLLCPNHLVRACQDLCMQTQVCRQGIHPLLNQEGDVKEAHGGNINEEAVLLSHFGSTGEAQLTLREPGNERREAGERGKYVMDIWRNNRIHQGYIHWKNAEAGVCVSEGAPSHIRTPLKFAQIKGVWEELD